MLNKHLDTHNNNIKTLNPLDMLNLLVALRKNNDPKLKKYRINIM